MTVTLAGYLHSKRDDDDENDQSAQPTFWTQSVQPFEESYAGCHFLY